MRKDQYTLPGTVERSIKAMVPGDHGRMKFPSRTRTIFIARFALKTHTKAEGEAVSLEAGRGSKTSLIEASREDKVPKMKNVREYARVAEESSGT